MMNVEVTRYGMTPEQLLKKVQIQFISVKDAAETLGNNARDLMRKNIEDARQRMGGTGRLQKAINVYVEDAGLTRTVGVGSIPELNYLAPYWYIVNYGGLTTVAARGESLYGYYGMMIVHGRPRADLRGANIQGGKVATEKFTPLSVGGYRMTPTAPIWPHNYIEKTANWVSTVARIHYSGALRKITIK